MIGNERPVDRRMVVRLAGEPRKAPWWTPAPLTWWFIVLLVLDALILLIATGVRSSDNDAAGNGMANAFREVSAEAGTVLVGCLALLFLIIRHGGARIGVTTVLALITLALPMLLQ